MKWFYSESGTSVWKMYLSFDGRLDRLTLWLRIVLLNVFTYIVFYTMGTLSEEYTSINFSSGVNVLLITYWFCLTTLWVRRFHDRNVSGVWYGLFALAVPAVIAMNIWANFHLQDEALKEPMSNAALGLLVLVGLAGLYILARFGFTKSMPGDNKYGPEPGVRRAAPPQKAGQKGKGKKSARRVRKVVVKKTDKVGGTEGPGTKKGKMTEGMPHKENLDGRETSEQ